MSESTTINTPAPLRAAGPARTPSGRLAGAQLINAVADQMRVLNARAMYDHLVELGWNPLDAEWAIHLAAILNDPMGDRAITTDTTTPQRPTRDHLSQAEGHGVTAGEWKPIEECTDRELLSAGVTPAADEVDQAPDVYYYRGAELSGSGRVFVPGHDSVPGGFDELDEVILDTKASVIAKLDAATDFDAVLADIYAKAGGDPSVVNTITSAVTGNVIQAQNIHGDA